MNRKNKINVDVNKKNSKIVIYCEWKTNIKL